MPTLSIFLMLSGGAWTWNTQDDEDTFSDLIAVGAVAVGIVLGATHLLIVASNWAFSTFFA